MTLHADALALLTGWDPPSPEQATLRDRYVAHLRAHPDGLSRDCWPDHVTASTVLLSHDRSRVLLTLHAKAQRWFQLGGHCEPGDTTLAGAALREATEESGIPAVRLAGLPVHLDEHEVPFCGATADVHHLDVRFVALAPAGATAAVSEESLDLRWWPVDELPDPELAEVVAHALAAAAQSTSEPLGLADDSPGGGSSSAAADQPSR